MKQEMKEEGKSEEGVIYLLCLLNHLVSKDFLSRGEAARGIHPLSLFSLAFLEKMRSWVWFE